MCICHFHSRVIKAAACPVPNLRLYPLAGEANQVSNLGRLRIECPKKPQCSCDHVYSLRADRGQKLQRRELPQECNPTC